MKSLILICLLLSSSANAYNPILRDYHSVRAAGMGDVRYTTGLFEENLYGNPARSTDNPESLFQLPQISVEASGAAIGSFGPLTKLLQGNTSDLSAFSSSVGKPLSARLQLVLPGYYAKNFISHKWSFGVALTMTAQTIAEVSQSGLIDPTTFLAGGPAINLARRFLDEDRLSVGTTLHTEFRGNSRPPFGIQRYLASEKVFDIKNSSSTIGYDFDLGLTFKPHWTLGGFKYELGAAINNILGGKYDNISKHAVSSWTGSPFQYNRAYNFGVSATHDNFLFFRSALFALEFTDFGNNPDGSVFKTIHLGSEFKWATFAARVGISQGYLTAGFGLDLWLFQLNLATYAEELGLNPGVMEDRRYALQLGFQI